MIAGAVEIKSRDEKSYPGRIRLSEISDYTAETLRSFVESEVADGSTVKTDGLASYNNLVGTDHDKQVVGNQLPITCFLGFTVFSPTSKRGRSASTMACGQSTYSPTSTNSFPFQSKTKSTRRTKIAAQSGHEVQTHDLQDVDRI